MTYVEIAMSDGPGTLLYHAVMTIADDKAVPIDVGRDCVIQTLTEEEAHAFYEMHGGWVAV